MSKEAMKLAWEAEEKANPQTRYNSWCRGYEAALREALAKPDFWEGYVPEPVKPAQQEPVACVHKTYSVDAATGKGNCLACGAEGEMRFIVDTSPPAQRTWVGLTDEEIKKLTVELRDIPVTLAFAIEAKLKEKNNG